MHPSPTPTRRSPGRLGRTAAALAWLAAAGTTIVVLLLAASAAEGGTYRASLCNRHLGGARGGLEFDRSSDHYASTASCADGGGLGIRHTARRTNRDQWGAWGLEAPAGATITRVRAAAAGTAAAGHV